MKPLNALIGVTIVAMIAVAALAAAPALRAQTAFTPAAVVNDDIITYYDIDQRVLLLQLNGATAGAELNDAALEQLVDDRLRKQAAERAEITATDEALAGARQEFAGRIGVDQATLAARLGQLDVDEAALNDFLSSQVMWRELVQRRFGSRATPSEVELDQEIALAAAGETTSYRLSEIGVPVGTGQERQAQQLIARIQRELESGADFAALARRFSRTPSAENGGDVGWVPETSLPPDLGQLVAQTPVGAVTPPFEVPGGVSLFRVADQRTTSNSAGEETVVTLRRISVPVGVSADISAASDRARALGEAARSCEGTPDLGDDADFETIDAQPMDSLPGPVQDAVQLLQVGQASRPVQAQSSVDVFVLCERTGGLDAEQRAQLRDQIRNRRLAQLAQGYLQDLRREAVIERR